MNRAWAVLETLKWQAIEQIPGAIVAAGSTQVDVASGATLTSERLFDAVAQCLDEASK